MQPLSHPRPSGSLLPAGSLPWGCKARGHGSCLIRPRTQPCPDPRGQCHFSPCTAGVCCSWAPTAPPRVCKEGKPVAQMFPTFVLGGGGTAGCNTIALSPGMCHIDFPQGKVNRAVGCPMAAGDLGRDKPLWLSPQWGSCHQHVAVFTQPRASGRVTPGTQILQDNLSKC